jgi:hypothetical protein
MHTKAWHFTHFSLAGDQATDGARAFDQSLDQPGSLNTVH